MDKLTFDELIHQYKYDGAVVPSVTQILKGVGMIDFSNVPSHLLDQACKFGTAAHKATELYDLGTLDEAALDLNLRPYLDGWIKFKKDTGFEVVTIEQMYFSSIYRFAGKPDRIGRIDGVLTIPDIKTSFEISPANAIQLSGYEMLVAESMVIKEKIQRMTVLLTPDGNYKIEVYKGKSDSNIFLAALSVYNWRAKNGKLA